MHFEVYRACRGTAVKPSWYWRLRARNGRIVADSAEGYARKGAALAGVALVQGGAAEAEVKLLD